MWNCKLLEGLEEQIRQVELKLAELARADQRVKQLRTAPWVGPRLSEAVVTIIDDPHRFKSARQVSSYSGLTPRRWQSGESDRQGHISHAGNRLLRGLLVEVAWLGVRANTWMKQVYENVRRGSDKRKKIAIVAVARRLLVKLWAMLRTEPIGKTTRRRRECRRRRDDRKKAAKEERSMMLRWRSLPVVISDSPLSSLSHRRRKTLRKARATEWASRWRAFGGLALRILPHCTVE